MKKILLIAVAVLTTAAVNAKVWRVNPNEDAKADFLSLTAACESEDVEQGDTLYCEPGSYAEQQRITKKKITILGPGWGFKNNIGSTGNSAEARFTDGLLLLTDSFTIAGLWVSNIHFNSGGKMVTIERCHVGCITGGGEFRNIDIRNNFFDPVNVRAAINIDAGSNYIANVSIENNIVFVNKTGDYSHENGGQIILYSTEPTKISAVIAHNTVVGNYSNYYNVPAVVATHSVIRDNIFINLNKSESDSYVLNFDAAMGTNQVYNNVFSINQEKVDAKVLNEYGASNFFVSATLENTFTCTKVEDAEETFFYLKEGSVAKNKAFQGEDCGAFAGGWPYVVYCRPLGLPYIYDVVVPNYTSGNEMTISFKVKANNQ